MTLNLPLLISQIINVFLVLSPLIILMLLIISLNRRFRKIEQRLADLEGERDN